MQFPQILTLMIGQSSKGRKFDTNNFALIARSSHSGVCTAWVKD